MGYGRRRLDHFRGGLRRGRRRRGRGGDFIYWGLSRSNRRSFLGCRGRLGSSRLSLDVVLTRSNSQSFLCCRGPLGYSRPPLHVRQALPLSHEQMIRIIIPIRPDRAPRAIVIGVPHPTIARDGKRLAAPRLAFEEEAPPSVRGIVEAIVHAEWHPVQQLGVPVIRHDDVTPVRGTAFRLGMKEHQRGGRRLEVPVGVIARKDAFVRHAPPLPRQDGIVRHFHRMP
mmetsp:Transcript_7480/g.18558  ORF Transcript_7480/g.18558 Transcript_7480/m.18558 type:complete len:226 (-) Transcript_7480:328-1005(-)